MSNTTLSFIFGGPGIVLWFLGINNPNPIIILSGTALLCIGLGFYARSKGYNILYGLVGIAGIIGVLLLSILKDKNKKEAK